LRFDEEEEEGDGGCEDRIDIMQNLLEVVRHARGAVEVDFSRCVGVRLFNGPRGMKWMREVVEELGDRSRWNFQHSALVVDSVVKCLKDFRVLNLASTLHVTDSVFETWREKNCLQDLQVLSLRWARNVGTDQTLRILADHCRRLTHCYLRGCDLVSDFGIQALALGLHIRETIQELDLCYCNISDRGLRCLALLSALESLDLAAKVNNMWSTGTWTDFGISWLRSWNRQLNINFECA